MVECCMFILFIRIGKVSYSQFNSIMYFKQKHKRIYFLNHIKKIKFVRKVKSVKNNINLK